MARGTHQSRAEVFRGSPSIPGGQPDAANRSAAGAFLLRLETCAEGPLGDQGRVHGRSCALPRLLALAERVEAPRRSGPNRFSTTRCSTACGPAGGGGHRLERRPGLDFATANTASAASSTERMNLFSHRARGITASIPCTLPSSAPARDFISRGTLRPSTSSPEAILADFAKFGFKERPPGPLRYEMADEFRDSLEVPVGRTTIPVDFEGEHYQCYGGLRGTEAGAQAPPHPQ